MHLKEIVSTRIGKPNYYMIRNELWEDEDGEEVEFEGAYTIAGDYIGDLDMAKELCDELLIQPRPRDEAAIGSGVTCQIGYCEMAQRWYAWGKGGRTSYVVGSKVTPQDGAYIADKGEWTAESVDCAKQMAIDFATNTG